jgi:hypothetical protein
MHDLASFGRDLGCSCTFGADADIFFILLDIRQQYQQSFVGASKSFSAVLAGLLYCTDVTFPAFLVQVIMTHERILSFLL